MFKDLTSLILEALWYVVPGVILILLVTYRKRVHVLLVSAWCRACLPSKENDQSAVGNWFGCELWLCNLFHAHYAPPEDPEDFEKANSYLRKVHEIGRREMPAWGWILIFVLLVAEALSFGILLAGYAAQSASLQNQTRLGYLVAALLAGSLLWLTHETGRQLHKNALFNKVNRLYAVQRAKDPTVPLPGRAPIASLNNDSADDGSYDYLQIMARVPHEGEARKSHVLSVITAIVVVALAAGGYYLRTEVHRQLMIQQTMDPAMGKSDTTDSATGDPQQDLTTILGGVTAAAVERGTADERASEGNAAGVAFGILTVLFVLMQLVGIVVGRNFGFSGTESKAAARITEGHSIYSQLVKAQGRFPNWVAGIAQDHLHTLQDRLHNGLQIPDNRLPLKRQERTFLAYVAEQQRVRKRQSSGTPPGGAPSGTPPGGAGPAAAPGGAAPGTAPASGPWQGYQGGRGQP